MFVGSGQRFVITCVHRSLPMRTASALLLFTLAVGPLAAQVVEVPGMKGQTLEFIGLKRRDAMEVLKEYQAKNPNTPVHACAACFKTQLGFAEAAVNMSFDTQKKIQTTVTVIEPEDAA